MSKEADDTLSTMLVLLGLKWKLLEYVLLPPEHTCYLAYEQVGKHI